MQKANVKRQYISLAGIYILFVAVRYGLALLTKAYPTVMIDEFLYYSLGKSIATKGTLLYRGQPAAYSNIVYPLLLSPIYGLFQPGTNYFHLIQLWNILLMNLSIFPIYALNNAIFQNSRKALLVTCLCMILPDFLLGEYIFSEAVIYPLFFTLVYCIYRYLHQKELKYSIWTGVLGTALFYTKPGAATLTGVAFAYFLIEGIRKKNKKEIWQAVIGVGCFCVTFVAFQMVVRFAFGYDDTLLGVYDKQFQIQDGITVGSMLQTLLYYPYYFILGCGIVPILLCFTRYRDVSKDHRDFLRILLICLLLTMAGTTVLVNGPEGSDLAYLRYIAMFIPLTFISSIMPSERPETELERKSLNIPTAILSIFLIAGTAIWGVFAGISSMYGNHAQMPLAGFAWENAKGVLNILALFAGFASLWYFSKKFTTKQRMKASCIAYVAICLINTFAGYAIANGNGSKEQAKASKEIQDQLAGKEYLFVYTNDHLISDHGLDVNSRSNNDWIALYDFFNHLYQNDGIYVPFIPNTERGMNSNDTTGDVDTLILEHSAYAMIQFSENTSQYHSEDGYFYVVQIPDGERIIDSIIGNIELYYLKPNFNGILLVYKEDWLTKPIIIRMDIESDIGQDMTFVSNYEKQSIHLEEGRHMYDIRFDNPAQAYNFTVPDRTIRLYHYEILNEE